ncbi:MAG TPA: PQQ-binding-like beta-propeller repeat protein [Planctomycetota bacterium]
MSFKGDLSTIGLAEVFQMISMSQKEGTLVVVDTDSRKSIYFGPSGIRLLSTGRRKGQRLGDMLVRAGKVAEDQLADALENAKIQRRRIGEILVESGLVADGDIDQVVREQIEEEIYDLFLWKRADFEFVEGPPSDDLTDPELPVTKLSFDVNGLLLEAVRRADEWSVINQKVPSLDSVFTFCTDADRGEEDKVAPDALKRVYRLLDGQRTVLEIVEATGVGKFEACKGLIDLQERGRIRLLTVQETMDLAAARMNNGHKDAALRMFVAAAAQSAKDPKILSNVARVLENEGLSREAAVHHSKASAVYLELGELDRALDHAQSALQLQPDDPIIKMAMFEVHAALGNLDEGKKVAKELAMQSLVAPDYAMTRGLCDRILHVDPTDLDFRMLRAKALLRSGDKAGAEVDVEFIRKNLPKDSKDAERIERDLREFAARTPTAAPPKSATGPQRTQGPKGKRTWLKIKVAVALLVLAGVGAGVYEGMARKSFGGTLTAAEALAGELKFDDARARMDAFLSGPFRFSPGQRERAEAFLTDLASRRLKLDAEKMDLELKRKTELRESLRKGLAAAREGRARDPEQALSRARGVRAQADAASEQDLRAECDAFIAEMEKYIADSLQLKVRADAFEKEGKFRDAALMIDRLKAEFPNTDAAQGSFYPLEIVTRPSGLKITNLQTSQVVGESREGRFVHRMRAGETVRLLFEKPGWGSAERSVKEKTIGRISVELLDKKLAWAKPLGVTSSGEPAVSGDTLYLAGGSRLYALRLDPFALLWFESLDAIIEGGTRPAKNRVYAGTSSGEVVGLDPGKRDGRVVVRKSLEERITATPGVSTDERALFVSTGDRHLRALKAADFEELWRTELPAESRLEAVQVGAVVVAACSDGTMLGLNAKTGEIVWTLKADGPLGPLTVSEGKVYANSTDQHVYAVDAKSGERVWRRLLPALPTGRPAHAKGLVVTSAKDGRVYMLAEATGVPQGVYPTDGPILGGVTVAGSLALFGSDDTSFYAYDLEQKALSWRLKTPGPVRQPAVVVGGRAYFSGTDSLFAVDLE